VTVAAPAPTVDEAKLSELAGAKPAEPPPPPPAPKDTPGPVNLEAANEKLSDLLGGKS
jgi:hypothetical protein